MASTATIQGPLLAGLHRDETGEIRLNYSHRTAEDFVVAAAALMRLRGREVSVERSTEHGIEILDVYTSHRCTWHDSTLQLIVSRFARPGARWRLGVAVAHSSSGRTHRARSRRDAAHLVEVYGR